MQYFHNLKKSFEYALEGIFFSFKENQNIKIHIIIAFLVLIFGFLLGFSRYELFTVGLLIVLVISAEMINCAIEEVVDLLVDQHNEHARIAKDVSAGMVLVISLFALIIGIFAFLPHVLSFFN